MYFVIIGAGTLGKYLTKILLEEGHKVVVIEKDEEIGKKLGDELEVTVLINDGSNPRVMQDAGVSEADTVIILTESDETNLVTALLAKEYGAKKVAARLTKVHYNDATVNKLGIDLVIHPEAVMASYIAEMLTKPTIIDLAFFTKGNAEILEYLAPKKLIGKKMSEINLPTNTTIFALYDNSDKLVIPKNTTKIKEGYKLLILAETNEVRNIRKIIEE